MSSPKNSSVIKSEDKQSFDYLFGDDLCEEILQYLPLRDKLRLEGVSTQFQRTIFQRQSSLTGKDIPITKGVFDFQRLEEILSKCTRIKIVDLKCMDHMISPSNGRQLIDLLVKYCRNVIEINANLLKLDKEYKLPKIINHGALTITGNNIPNDSKLFEFLSSVKKLHIRGNLESLIPIMALKNLKSVHFHSNDVSTDICLKVMENNRNIRHLSMKRNSGLEEGFDLRKLCQNISRLKNLIELNICGIDINDGSVVEDLKQIALNCTQLKSIYCKLKSATIHQIFDGMSVLSAFKNLKRLNLVLIDPIDLTTLDIFKGFEGLTHLNLSVINSFGYLRLEDGLNYKKLFENISNLKDLVKLNICNIYINDGSVAKEFKKIALNCSQMKSISCKLRFESIQELSEGMSLLKTLKNLKRLDLSLNDGIDLTTLDSFSGFEGLTHLKFSNSSKITEPMLLDLVYYLPKLTHLSLDPYLEVTENTADILSLFPRLQSISLIKDPSVHEFR